MNSFLVGFEVALTGFFIGIVISIPLGPAGIESVKRSLSEGYKSGMVFILGSLMADLIYMLLLYIGLATIFTSQTRKGNLYYWIISGIILIMANHLFKKREKKHRKQGKTLKNSFVVSYLSGFVLTFLNPASITVWLTLSALSVTMWGAAKHSHHFLFLWSAWFGMLAWFFILNYLASKGLKFILPNEKHKKSNFISQIITRLMDNSMTIVGAGFIVYGIYEYITKIQ